jgi:hypothetical protein
MHYFFLWVLKAIFIFANNLGELHDLQETPEVDGGVGRI